MVDGLAGRPGIRVLRLLSRLNVGGPSHHVIALTRDLRPRGFETRLAVGYPHACEGNMFAEAHQEGVEPCLIPGLDRPIHPLADTQAFLGILKAIREYRPHIVHTHTTKGGVLGRLAALVCRVPIIAHTFHGHVFSGYFSEAGSFAALTLERILAAHTDRLITLSPLLRIDLLNRLRPSKPEKVQVVPLGLPLQRFLICPRHTGFFRGHLGLKKEDCLWGIVARLVPVKNHALLIDQVARLAPMFPNLHLAIVGGGELEDTLQQQAHRLGMTDRIHFTGIFHPIEHVYADLDLLLLTSLNEGTPVVLMEALAAGCPIAATKVGGVSEVLRQAGSGMLLTTQGTALSLQLTSLVRSFTPDSSLPTSIREATVSRYSFSSLADQTTALYQPLLEKRVPGFASCQSGQIS